MVESNDIEGESTDGGLRDIHRIGGGGVENLRLKLAEIELIPPGISVLKAASPDLAAAQMRTAFPTATALHELAKTVGSTNETLIRNAGFGIMPDRTRRFPNHLRIIHVDGATGFKDENLVRLSMAFVNSIGH